MGLSDPSLLEIGISIARKRPIGPSQKYRYELDPVLTVPLVPSLVHIDIFFSMGTD
jgi:hypothetical protein